MAEFRTSGMACALIVALAGMPGCVTSQAAEDEDQARRRAKTHFDLAVDHFENDRVEMALRELLIAERLDPENPRVHHAMGIAYLQKGKPVEAEEHLRAALKTRPEYHDARFNLSTLYLNQGRYDECIAQAQQLVDDPTYSLPHRALTNQGWAVHEQGDTVRARRLLERAREFDPQYWPTLLNLGILEAEGGHRSEAIGLFNQVLALDPGPSAVAEVSYRLAKVYVALGKRDEAVRHLRTAVVKAPSDPWGMKSEKYLQLLR